MEYQTTPEFQKDLKKLAKKYRTLKDDLKILLNSSITIFHEQDIDNKGNFVLKQFCKNDIKAYKVKKFASKSFKGKGVNSGLRLIYIYQETQNKIILIELYYKGYKTNENSKRIEKYFLEMTQE